MSFLQNRLIIACNTFPPSKNPSGIMLNRNSIPLILFVSRSSVICSFALFVFRSIVAVSHNSRFTNGPASAMIPAASIGAFPIDTYPGTKITNGDPISFNAIPRPIPG